MRSRLCVAFSFVLIAGCGERGGGQKSDGTVPGSGAPARTVSYTADSGKGRRWDFVSPADVGRAVVAELNAKDREGLYRLLVSKQEYTEEMWPAFPASNPKFNFTPEFAWSSLNKKCIIGIEKWTARDGGQDLAFVEIRFTKPAEPYIGFRLHRGTVLTVKNPQGQEVELKFLGSIVEKGWRYKLLSYDD